MTCDVSCIVWTLLCESNTIERTPTAMCQSLNHIQQLFTKFIHLSCKGLYGKNGNFFIKTPYKSGGWFKRAPNALTTFFSRKFLPYIFFRGYTCTEIWFMVVSVCMGVSTIEGSEYRYLDVKKSSSFQLYCSSINIKTFSQPANITFISLSHSCTVLWGQIRNYESW